MTHTDSNASRDADSHMLEAVPSAAPLPAGTASPAMEPGRVREIGGRKDGTEPTRFGDWERNGRCVDF